MSKTRLGSLESAVMDVIWASPTPLTVRQVVQALGSTRSFAYTTVLTVMDNLHRSNVLDRSPTGGRANEYRARTSREEFTADVIDAALAGNPDPAGALIHFADRLAEEDLRRVSEALEELHRKSRSGP